MHMAAIWTKPISTEILTTTHIDTAAERLGIEFVEIGDHFIRGRMPVDHRTKQPYGVVHGGASVVLAETLGSCGADYCTPVGHRIVGLKVIRFSDGGTATPVQVLIRTVLMVTIVAAITFDENGRGVNERLSNTVLVKR
jgi:acyl-coenzyme A thioesterase PaaI-like protein